MAFVHLHNHTSYSPLDGIQKVKPMCAVAHADGQPAIAQTDHGDPSGWSAFAQAAQDEGVKPIIGIEAYLAVANADDPRGPVDGRRRNHPGKYPIPRSLDGDGDSGGEGSTKDRLYEHITLHALNTEGYASLVSMVNKSEESVLSAHGKRYPLMDFMLMDAHSKGVGALTGCMSGPVMGALMRGDVDTARLNLAALIDIYGRERLGVEIMDHDIEAERACIPQLVALAREFGLNLVATNDAHYTKPEDAVAHDAWLCVGRKRPGGKATLLNDPNRWRFNGTGYHLRSEAEMRALFDDQPGTEHAVTNAALYAEMVEENVLPEKKMRFPEFPIPEEYRERIITIAGQEPKVVADAADLLYAKCVDALPLKIHLDDPKEGPEALARARRELDVINGFKYASYFLVVADFIEWARSDRGYPTEEYPLGKPGQKEPILTGVGRGSGAGSLVAYLLGITNIHPLKYGLLFERFLDPSRFDFPDFDTDFEASRSAEVVTYLSKRWGEDNVARIGTLGVAWAKSIVNDVARTLDEATVATELSKRMAIVGPPKKTPLSKMLDPDSQRDSDQDLQTYVANNPKAAQVLELAQPLEGIQRSSSIHACGVVVADESLLDKIPLRHTKDLAEEWVTYWEAKPIESTGYVKIDVLSVKDWDVISMAEKLVRKRHGVELDLYNLPMGEGDYLNVRPAGLTPEQEALDNARAAATWRVFGEGRTAGIFQVAGGGITSLCRAVRPVRLSDLSAICALYRPGPMGTDEHNKFARRYRGGEEVEYTQWTVDPDETIAIAEVLGETMSSVTYQEQLQKMGRLIADMDDGATNKLRKAFSKKDEELMTSLYPMWVEGGMRNVRSNGEPKTAFSRETLDRLWKSFIAAGEYLFNACVTGDTVLTTGRGIGPNAETWTVEEMFRRLHGEMSTPDGLCIYCGENETATRGRRCSRCKSWHGKFHGKNRGNTILALDSKDGRIRPQRIADVRYMGQNDVYRVVLSDGRTVTSTDNHRWLSSEGYRELRDLSVGDRLVVSDGYEKQSYEPSSIRTTFGPPVRNEGHKPWLSGPMNSGFVDGGFVQWKKFRDETLETAVCAQADETCSNSRLEIAHLDGDRTNNDPSNLSWMCVPHHKRYDYAQNERRGRWGKGHASTEATIVSIEHVGRQDVYDVEMADGTDHNFLANGVVSHNSHSYAYAYVSYITAFLKANWPSEYGAALLANTSKNKPGKRVATLRSLIADGVVVKGPDVNKSEMYTSVDSEGAVRIGLAEVQDGGKNAEFVIRERSRAGAFTSLHDLMRRVRLPESSTNPTLTKKMPVSLAEAFIDAGACDEFGPRLGLRMVARASKKYEVPVPDARWGVEEASVREHERLGIALGVNPLVNLGAQVGEWREEAQRSARPVPVHLIPKEDRQYITTLGVISSLNEKNVRTGTMWEGVIAGSMGSVAFKVWPRTVREFRDKGIHPTVGAVYGISGRTSLTEPPRDPNADDAEQEWTDDDLVLEVTINSLWRGPLNDPRTFGMPEYTSVIRDVGAPTTTLTAAENKRREKAEHSAPEQDRKDQMRDPGTPADEPTPADKETPPPPESAPDRNVSPDSGGDDPRGLPEDVVLQVGAKSLTTMGPKWSRIRKGVPGIERDVMKIARWSKNAAVGDEYETTYVTTTGVKVVVRRGARPAVAALLTLVD